MAYREKEDMFLEDEGGCLSDGISVDSLECTPVREEPSTRQDKEEPLKENNNVKPTATEELRVPFYNGDVPLSAVLLEKRLNQKSRKNRIKSISQDKLQRKQSMVSLISDKTSKSFVARWVKNNERKGQLNDSRISFLSDGFKNLTLSAGNELSTENTLEKTARISSSNSCSALGSSSLLTNRPSCSFWSPHNKPNKSSYLQKFYQRQCGFLDKELIENCRKASRQRCLDHHRNMLTRACSTTSLDNFCQNYMNSDIEMESNIGDGHFVKKRNSGNGSSEEEDGTQSDCDIDYFKGRSNADSEPSKSSLLEWWRHTCQNKPMYINLSRKISDRRVSSRHSLTRKSSEIQYKRYKNNVGFSSKKGKVPELKSSRTSLQHSSTKSSFATKNHEESFNSPEDPSKKVESSGSRTQRTSPWWEQQPVTYSQKRGALPTPPKIGSLGYDKEAVREKLESVRRKLEYGQAVSQANRYRFIAAQHRRRSVPEPPPPPPQPSEPKRRPAFRRKSVKRHQPPPPENPPEARPDLDKLLERHWKDEQFVQDIKQQLQVE